MKRSISYSAGLVLIVACISGCGGSPPIPIENTSGSSVSSLPTGSDSGSSSSVEPIQAYVRDCAESFVVDSVVQGHDGDAIVGPFIISGGRSIEGSDWRRSFPDPPQMDDGRVQLKFQFGVTGSSPIEVRVHTVSGVTLGFAPGDRPGRIDTMQLEPCGKAGGWWPGGFYVLQPEPSCSMFEVVRLDTGEKWTTSLPLFGGRCQ